jgi:multicomponent Na+:H+ antiporter subunit D
MRFSLLVLAAGCIACGVLGGPIAAHVASPAASVVLHPAVYAHAVLAGHGMVPPGTVEFSYKLSDLLITAVELVLGIALAAWYLRAREPRPITLLRRLHTGSVNDYATFSVIGIVLAAYVLLS